MSMNKYMHPRNIYKTKPDFRQLAEQFPDFKKHVNLEKGTIDFKNPDSLRALACTLLKKDFKLDVCIPPDKLIPTIPLRLNYLLFIEDLLTIAPSTNSQVNGIDIATGAACTYPLMSARKYGWRMLAFEFNHTSYICAKSNVRKNNLDNLIEVIESDEQNLLTKILSSEKSFDFCMTNPPIYKSVTDFHNKAKNINRPKLKNSFCEDLDEAAGHVGELQFVTKLANESKALNDKIRIYTTLIGNKANLAILKKRLRELDVTSFKQTDFCQGNTTRWGLAWTYCNIDLRKVPESTLAAWRREKSKPCINHIFQVQDDTFPLQTVCDKIIVLFKQLELIYEECTPSKFVRSYKVTATSNTWMHQRRKRRQQARLASSNNEAMNTDANNTSDKENLNNSNSSEEEVFQDAVNMFKELQFASQKRSLEDEDEDTEYYNTKKFKAGDHSPEKTYFKFLLKVRSCALGFELTLHFIDGADTKTCKQTLHQIMQYFKNNLKLESATS